MWLIYPVVGLAAFFILLGFLVLSALVSKESVRENFKESAEYLVENEQFPKMEKGIDTSTIDRYADCILLNIAYCFDSDNPLDSVMWSKYYNSEKLYERENLHKAVFDDEEGNLQYLRYWHGSAGVVRLLHLFLNVEQIFILNGCILILLSGLLICKLLKNKYRAEAVVYILSLVSVSVWYVPFCLEYTWCFLCMAAFSLIIISMAIKGKYKYMGVVFMLSGIVTVFFDFLTTETISLLVPLLLVLSIRRHHDGNVDKKTLFKQELWFSFKNCALWFAGFILMWLAKWLTASIVLGENVMPYVQEHIDERLNGGIGNSSEIHYIWTAITRNIKGIFPLDHGLGGMIAACIVIFVIVYMCFVYRRKKIDWRCILLYLLIGLVPYLRYTVLRNHSAMHEFFTFRAQMASVLAVLLSVYMVIDTNLILKRKR